MYKQSESCSTPERLCAHPCCAKHICLKQLTQYRYLPSPSKLLLRAYTACLIAATAKAFTTVLAGFALTLISLPKAMRFPAFVAGLWRVLIMHTPGIVNFPVLLTSLPASSAKASKAFDISDLPM